MITDQIVRDIASRIFTSSDTTNEGRTTYLRTLIVAVQEVLPKHGLDKGTQLEAIQGVHQRFYPLVMEAAEAHVPKGTKGRGIELHRRTNFARTSVSSLRSHVRSGGDVCALKATTVTKAKLRGAPVKHATPARLLERRTQRLMREIEGVAAKDKDGALLTVRALMDALGQKLLDLGIKTTSSADLAMSDMRPLSHGDGMLVPVSLH